jgi:haloacetate dehalogenase
MFFEGFELFRVDLPEGHLRVRRGGSGPALLMLHGNPQTHAMWHKIAPALARRFTVICPDLRGYGGSHMPPATADHAPYAKRAMARDLIDLMDHLGFARFAVGSHDRGARVAHRLALDFPEHVTRLAVLDIVPTLEHFERTDMAFALGYYHWFWFAQPHPFPENLINAAPDIWWRAATSREDYRAAATIDLAHDRQSRAAGEKIRCDMLALWGSKGRIGAWYDPLDIWRSYCAGEVSGGPVASGHYLAEEAPEEVLAAFEGFFM